MIQRNNPDIDFDTVENDIARTLETYASDNTPATPETAEEMPHQDVPVSSLETLYSLDDETFVREAHRLFTGRPADPALVASLLTELQRGWPRSQIAAALRYSREARQRPENNNVRMRKSWLTYRLSHLPLLGPLMETLLALAAAGRLKRTTIRLQTALQACQQSVVDSHTQLHERLFELESQVNRLLLEKQQLLSKLELTQANLATRCEELEQRLSEAQKGSENRSHPESAGND